MKPLTCSRCGQEIRWGWRDGRYSWLHRDAVDHQTILGVSSYDKAEVERQRHLPRQRTVTRKGVDVVEDYTAASYEHDKMSKAARERADDEGDDDDEEPESELEPVECRSTPLNLKGVTDVVMLDGSTRPVETPGGARILINLAAKVGWEVIRLTYARGPFLGSKGGSLGVADSVVLVVRAPALDSGPRYGVASWRNAKSQFAWRVQDRTTTPVGARALAAWMKEEVPSG